MICPDEPASAAALAALAGEVEALRQAIAPLSTRVDELASVTADLARRIRDQAAPAETRAVPSWLLAPTDPAETRKVLDELDTWVTTVFLRYPDGALALPECWLWHPDIVEELLWLMHAWLLAYQGENAGVGLVGDWHDRYRPGVVRRLKAGIPCSLEVHRPGYPQGSKTKRRPDAVEPIARWWAEARHDRAPEPTSEHLATRSP